MERAERGGTGAHQQGGAGRAALTRQAERQLSELEAYERAEVERILDALAAPAAVHRYGYPVGDSPAGAVWRVRAGRIGVFVAVDEDTVLVVGFAVRRRRSIGWY